MIPLISRETSFGQNVSELVFGVNIFDWDLGFHVDSVKQPIMRNSVGSRHLSHCGTSSFDHPFDHSFIVFKNVQLRLSMRRMCVGGYVFHFTQLVNLLFFALHVGSWLCSQELPQFPGGGYVWVELSLVECKTSITMSQRSRAGNPSIRSPASRGMTSDSVELCETEVCFLRHWKQQEANREAEQSKTE